MLTAQSIEKELKLRGMGEAIRLNQAAAFLNITGRTIRKKITDGKIKDTDPRRGVVSRSALCSWLADDPYFAAALSLKKCQEGAFLPGAEVYRITITVNAGKDSLFGK